MVTMVAFFNSKVGRGVVLAAGLLAIVAIGEIAILALAVVVANACVVELSAFAVATDKVERKGDAAIAVVAQIVITVFGLLATVYLVAYHGLWLTMVVVATVYGENAIAQIAGKRFGTTPLAPRYSPSKTVEGAYWGWLGGILIGAAVLAPYWWFHREDLSVDWPAWGLIIGLIPPLAEAGDWVESRLKRLVGVKDSADLTRASGSRTVRALSLAAVFGRQGGALDKTDSLWVCLAFAAILLAAPAATMATLIVAIPIGAVICFFWSLKDRD